MLASAVASTAFLPPPTATRAELFGRGARMLAAGEPLRDAVKSWPLPTARRAHSHGLSARMMAAAARRGARIRVDAATSSGPLGRGADALFEDLFRRALETEASQDFRSYEAGRSHLRGDVGGYSGVVGVVREFVAARGALAALASQRVLRRLFPDWPPRFGAEAATAPPAARPGLLWWFEILFARPLPAFSAKLNARVTALAGQWLMGPCEVEDLSRDDAAAAVVPGDGAGQQVLVRRCRFLEEAKCASVCVNACKVPTQAFFNDDMGVPMRIVPDYETLECRFKFGVAPLEGGDEENELRAVACFSPARPRASPRSHDSWACHTMGERLPAATASRIGPRKFSP